MFFSRAIYGPLGFPSILHTFFVGRGRFAVSGRQEHVRYLFWRVGAGFELGVVDDLACPESLQMWIRISIELLKNTLSRNVEGKALEGFTTRISCSQCCFEATLHNVWCWHRKTFDFFVGKCFWIGFEQILLPNISVLLGVHSTVHTRELDLPHQ